MLRMGKIVDVVLTSPPYNTSRKSSDLYNKRYDVYQDSKSDQEYLDWTVEIFGHYDKVLKENGCVLYNLSYSAENTHLIWLTVAEIIRKTNFTTADTIVWKKSVAMPNNRSRNKLTRIVEYVFVFCRKSEFKTFKTNKNLISVVGKNGVGNYQSIQNFIEAKNNDGPNTLNKAIFSTDLVKKLLNIYAQKRSVIYDSFMGTGTSAIACKELELNYIGSEISKDQVEYTLGSLNEISNKGAVG